MRASALKRLRLGVGIVLLAALTLALADFRELVPANVAHWLAAVQFVPATVALATGALASGAVAVLLLLLTAALGRLYCSTLCPLGLYQDAVARVSNLWIRFFGALRNKVSSRASGPGGPGRDASGPGAPAPAAPRTRSLRLRFAPPSIRLRQGLFAAVVVSVPLFGWGGLLLSLLDPYSNYGRIASSLFRPLLAAANNLVVGPANALGLHDLFRVDFPWAGVGALVFPLAMLSVVTVMAALRGRLYCNTLCPVGTLLGHVAQRAAFRLSFDRASCTKCGDCLRACKAQCLDLRRQEIDFNRCVACYNCIDACEHGGISYRFAWGSATASAATSSPSRRAFLSQSAIALSAAAGAALPALGAAAGSQRSPAAAPSAATARDPRPTSRGIAPPGAVSVDRFLARCTACQLCISACPPHVLQPAFLEYGISGIMKPRLDFTANFCDFDCRRCAEVCPDGALTLLDLESKHTAQVGLAYLDIEKCVVKSNGTDCAACSEHCPTKAVYTIPFGDNLRLPEVDRELCIGCGACEYACPVQPVKAITVTGLRTHGVAKVAVEEKTAPAKKPVSDFPF